MFEQAENRDLFAGLRELAESAFPKRCRGCGRVYASAAEFIAATHALRPNCSGLKQGCDDDEHLVVELFRNCECGSTLMETFNDRRDLSEAGSKRRRRFEEIFTYLVGRGIAADIAHNELLKLMHGQANDVLPLIKQKSRRTERCCGGQ